MDSFSFFDNFLENFYSKKNLLSNLLTKELLSVDMFQVKNLNTKAEAKRIKSLPHSINFLPKDLSFFDKDIPISYCSKPNILTTNSDFILSYSQTFSNILFKSESLQSLRSYNFHHGISLKKDLHASYKNEGFLDDHISSNFKNKLIKSNFEITSESFVNSNDKMPEKIFSIGEKDLTNSKYKFGVTNLETYVNVSDNGIWKDSAYSSMETQISTQNEVNNSVDCIKVLDFNKISNSVIEEIVNDYEDDNDYDSNDDDVIFNDDDDLISCSWSNKSNNSKFIIDDNNDDDDEEEIDIENNSNNEGNDLNEDDDDWFLDDSRYISQSDIKKDTSSESSPKLFSIDSCPHVSPTWDSGILEELQNFLRNPYDEKTNNCEKTIQEVNKRWCQFYKGSSSPSRKSSRSRMVQFSSSHHLVTCYEIDSEECRAGPWEEMGRDRVRFQNRIDELTPILSPVLTTSHRCKILKLLNQFI